MKLLITTGIFPPDIGGPARQIEYFATDLFKAGFKVTVLTYGGPACNALRSNAGRFELKQVSKTWPIILRQLIFGWKTFYLGRRADIIYTTDLYSPGYYSRLAAKFWQKKFIVRFAGDSAWETALNRGVTNDDILTFQGKKYSSFIEKLKNRRAKILKSADAIIAVSNFMKNLAIKIGVQAEKIKVIYNAVDFLEKIPELAKPASPTLVTACRLTPWKGVAMLIEIISSLKKKFPGITLQVVGDGPEREKLCCLAEKLKLSDRVIFHGRLTPKQTLQVFSQSSIFALNSAYEGLAHTILEAMTLGIPVIASRVGGNPETIKHGQTGLLVVHNNQEQWLKAISSILENPDLAAKLASQAKQDLKRFSWQKLIEETIEVFKYAKYA